MRKIITRRKEGIISGFKIKKKNYIRKLNKVFISKPLFKHTSFNLIIDLFVYNNKTNKLKNLKICYQEEFYINICIVCILIIQKKLKKLLIDLAFFILI